MENYYGQSAYRSDQPRQQAAQQQLPHLGFAERLSWGHTNPRLPLDLQGKGNRLSFLFITFNHFVLLINKK